MAEGSSVEEEPSTPIWDRGVATVKEGDSERHTPNKGISPTSASSNVRPLRCRDTRSGLCPTDPRTGRRVTGPVVPSPESRLGRATQTDGGRVPCVRLSVTNDSEGVESNNVLETVRVCYSKSFTTVMKALVDISWILLLT